MELIAFAAILGGGISNLFERVFFNSCVYDYFNFFGVFNINASDIFINLGLLVLFFAVFSSSLKKSSKFAAN